MHHWLQQPRDLVSARPNKTSRDWQTPRRKAGRHQCCNKPHARAGMSQACSRLLFIGMQIDAVLLPSASLPNTSSTCRLCRTASPSWLQVPCWLMLSNRRMRCGRLTACRFDGTPTYDGTHAGSDWLYAHTERPRCSASVAFFSCAHTLQSIQSTACMCVSTNDPIGICQATPFQMKHHPQWDYPDDNFHPNSLKEFVPATVDQMLYTSGIRQRRTWYVAASGDKLSPRLEITCCYICKRRLLRG